MTKFKCDNCGAIQEEKRKPEKCPECGKSDTMKKQESCCCSCKH